MGRPKGSKNKPKFPPPIEPPKVEEPKPTPISIPPVAWTPDDWKANPAVQQLLKNILDDPVFRMACQSLLVTALPCAKPVVAPNVDAAALAYHDSMKLHNRSGFVGFFRALHKLVQLKGAPTPKTGWGEAELIPEDE